MNKPLTFIIGMSLTAHPAFAQPGPEDGQPAAQLPGVVVTGEGAKRPGSYNPKTLSLPKMPAPLLNTPQSATVVPKEVMQDQAVTTLREALDNVSGISLAAGEGGAQGDSLTIRGFSARSDMFVDGMRDFGNYFRDPYNLEEIEVLKGPSSFTFGRGSTGGALNQVSKSAKLEKSTTGTVMGGSDATRRATLDANTPLSESSAFRLNVMAHENNVAERDVAQNRRFGFAPSLAFGLGKATQLKVNYFHQSENNIPDYGIPVLLSKPAPVDRKNYYGFKDTNFARTDVDIATIIAEHATAGGTIWRNQLRYALYERVFQTTAPRIAGTPTASTPLSSITVNRSQVAIDSKESILANDTSMTTEFGPENLRHTLVTGVEAAVEESTPVRKSFTGVPATSLLNPEPAQPFAGTASIASRVKTQVATVAAYLVDTFKIGKAWELIAGIRYDYFDAKTNNLTTNTKLDRFDNLTSYRGALVYKPRENGSVYFGYGTSFNPSAEQISLSAANAELKPESSQTFELGTKWELAGGDLTLNGAVFRTEKNNARVPDPNDPTLNALSGKHRVQGVEVGATGRIAPRWQIFAGYTYLDSKVVKSTTAGEEGARLANSPAHSVSLWGTNDLTDRWQWGTGFVHVSERTTGTTPDAATGLIRKVDGYWRMDAMAKYKMSKDVAVQLNIANVLDTKYMESVYPAHVIPAAGRSFYISGLFNF